MANSPDTPGIVAGRLATEAYAANFAEGCRALAPAEAHAAAERCLLCEDAPCVSACPTAIDVPRFIQQIGQGDTEGAGLTILGANILGGMCARVCPVDSLCEGACVRKAEGEAPVEIARLQRHACDHVMAEGPHPFVRARPTGQHVAVVGAGPAGLACAHGLARAGHNVSLFDARDKPGGLNEYGVAAYKSPAGFAQAEVAWLMQIGGISLHMDVRLGRDLALSDMREDFDAVFLGLGLAGVNMLRTEGAHFENVIDAVDFIAALRQAARPELVPVGRDVVVIGGGRTACDAAVQARLLGAERVTLVYRHPAGQMPATEAERHHATSKGVRIVTGAMPRRIRGTDRAEAVEFARGDAAGTVFEIPADQVLKAIGQTLEDAPGGLHLEGRKIAVDGFGRTSLPGVWAGGDCATGQSDLTVHAVAQGRDAARDIDRALRGVARDAG